MKNIPNPNVSVSKGVDFCPICNAMMFKNRGMWACGSCGYRTNDPSKTDLNFNTIKRKTYIDLIVEKRDLKFNHLLSISGHVNLKNEYVLADAQIGIFFGGVFIKNVYTDERGYFESSFKVNRAGRQEVKAHYRGNEEFESSIAKVYVNVIKQKNIVPNTPRLDSQVIDDLERIGELYQRGILTYKEFQELKRRLIG